MTRTFQDSELLLWEAYAAAPKRGKDQEERRKARILFHCITDRTRRARVLVRDGDRTEVENQITGAGDAELIELLETAEPLN